MQRRTNGGLLEKVSGMSRNLKDVAVSSACFAGKVGYLAAQHPSRLNICNWVTSNMLYEWYEGISMNWKCSRLLTCIVRVWNSRFLAGFNCLRDYSGVDLIEITVANSLYYGTAHNYTFCDQDVLWTDFFYLTCICICSINVYIIFNQHAGETIFWNIQLAYLYQMSRVHGLHYILLNSHQQMPVFGSCHKTICLHKPLYWNQYLTFVSYIRFFSKTTQSENVDTGQYQKTRVVLHHHDLIEQRQLQRMYVSVA